MTKFVVRVAAMPAVRSLRTTANLTLQRGHGEHPDFVTTKFVRIASLVALVKMLFLMHSPSIPDRVSL
ncbi:MAG: hypothetical protein ACJ8HJ_13565 [Massilia sp.]|jgi:hypothetical protein